LYHGGGISAVMLLVDGEVIVVGELELWYRYGRIGDSVASVMLLGVARQQAMCTYLSLTRSTAMSHVLCHSSNDTYVRGSFLLVKAIFALRTCKRVPVLST
jgi:hypothetical protein